MRYIFNYVEVKVKVKHYHYRPKVPRGFQKVKFPVYVTMAQHGKVVNLNAPAAFTPKEILLVRISVRD